MSTWKSRNNNHILLHQKFKRDDHQVSVARVCIQRNLLISIRFSKRISYCFCFCFCFSCWCWRWCCYCCCWYCYVLLTTDVHCFVCCTKVTSKYFGFLYKVSFSILSVVSSMCIFSRFHLSYVFFFFTRISISSCI